MLVTGGSEGLGLALARGLARRGARRVTLVARDPRKLSAAVETLEDDADSEGPGKRRWAPRATFEAVALPCDLTDDAATEAALGALAASDDPPDALFLNAGRSTPGLLLDPSQTVEVHRRTLDLNVLAAVRCLRALGPGLVRRGHGGGHEGRGARAAAEPHPQHAQHVVLVGSAMSLVGFVGYGSYAPSKWAVRGLADTLRNEWSGVGKEERGWSGAAGSRDDAAPAGTCPAADPTAPLLGRAPLSLSGLLLPRRRVGPGVSVSVAFPTDVETPGYAAESITKPPATRLISLLGSKGSPDRAAEAILSGWEGGLYHLPSTDPLNDLVAQWGAGAAPRRWGALCDAVLLAVPGSVVTRAFRGICDWAVRRHPGVGVGAGAGATAPR